MSNKCKWEDGKFVPCDGFDPHGGNAGCSCYSCGEGILRPPEPSVIIKKSGGTWVARYDGVDYLYLGEQSESCPDFFVPLEIRVIGSGVSSKWNPIKDITITDEIAKLRPMVITGRKAECLEVLWGVDEKECLTENPVTLRTNWTNRAVVRLATVGDLS